MADRRKKGEDGKTIIWISQERWEISRWNKKALLIVFERLAFGEKIKKQRTQALKSAVLNLSVQNLPLFLGPKLLYYCTFRLKFERRYWHFWNQHPWICQYAKNHAKQTSFKLVSYLGN